MVFCPLSSGILILFWSREEFFFFYFISFCGCGDLDWTVDRSKCLLWIKIRVRKPVSSIVPVWIVETLTLHMRSITSETCTISCNVHIKTFLSYFSTPVIGGDRVSLSLTMWKNTKTTANHTRPFVDSRSRLFLFLVSVVTPSCSFYCLGTPNLISFLY